jgi:carbonic anhydrase
VKTRLLEGNKFFRNSPDLAVMKRLSKKQEPFVAILACADSRVNPEKVFGLSLGDAFVVRVGGNTRTDPTVFESIEYAVEHLNVRAVVVFGHTDCGVAKAVVDDGACDELGSLYADMCMAKGKLPSDKARDPDAISESNVRLQVRKLLDQSCVIREAVDSGKLSIIGAMLELSTGMVKFL